MKLGKSLVLTLTLSALVGLTSCTKTDPKPDPKPEGWTALQKKQMVQYAAFEFPEDESFKGHAALSFNTPGEDAETIGDYLAFYTIKFDDEVSDDTIQAFFDSHDMELTEDGDWYNVSDETDVAYFANCVPELDFEESPLFAQIAYDADTREIEVYAIAFSFDGVKSYVDSTFKLYGFEDRTFEDAYGENFPEYETEYAIFLTEGPETSFTTRKYRNDNHAVELFFNDYSAEKMAAFKAGAATAGWHIYDWPYANGSDKNDHVYTNKTQDGAFYVYNAYQLVLLDDYTADKYRADDLNDVCHPPVIESIELNEETGAYTVTYEAGNSFTFTCEWDEEEGCYICEAEGHNVDFSDRGFWVVDGVITTFKVDFFTFEIELANAQYNFGFSMTEGGDLENPVQMGEGVYAFYLGYETYALGDLTEEPVASIEDVVELFDYMASNDYIYYGYEMSYVRAAVDQPEEEGEVVTTGTGLFASEDGALMCYVGIGYVAATEEAAGYFYFEYYFIDTAYQPEVEPEVGPEDGGDQVEEEPAGLLRF